MYGREAILLWLILLWTQVKLSGQEPASSQLFNEDYLYRDESMKVPHEIYEQYADLIFHPLNLNSASSDQLGESGLFTPYQIFNLINYRESYGRLYSVFELAALAGFRMSRLREIAPLLTVEAGLRIREQKQNRHMIMANVGKILPEAAGYGSKTEDGPDLAYKGHPIRTNLRIKSSFGRSLSLGLTYEKDAGEHFYVDRKPEFLSGYIQYKGFRVIRQLVIGNFQLNQGLGLVNGAGFFHSPESFQVSRQSMLRIRPYSSKSESGFERGAGLKMDLNLLELLCWVSYRSLDLSVSEPPENLHKIDWRDFLRTTGLHRTDNEMEGRNMAFRFRGGVHGLFSYRNLDAGMAFTSGAVGLTPSGTSALGIHSKAVIINRLSLHGNWLLKKWQIFGEVGVSDWKSLALLAGVRWEANDFLQGLVLLHHYGRFYGGSQASAYASGSKVSNEMGIALHVHLEPDRLIRADLSGELFHYPGPRYLTLVPSIGQRYSITVQNSGSPKFQWRIRMVNKLWQRTPSTLETGVRPLRDKQVSRFDFRFIYDHGIQWQSRMIASFLSDSKNSYPAYAVVQQVGSHLLKYLKFNLQFVVFDIRDWDNRIYLYEPGLYYSFNFPGFYGTGQKTSLVLSLKPLKKLTISGKIACTAYQQKKTLGTGNDLIPGNKKWGLELQLRLNL